MKWIKNTIKKIFESPITYFLLGIMIFGCFITDFIMIGLSVDEIRNIIENSNSIGIGIAYINGMFFTLFKMWLGLDMFECAFELLKKKKLNINDKDTDQ